MEFISKILHTTHLQWISCNFTLHDQQRGYLWIKGYKRVLSEIKMLLDREQTEVSQRDICLLEFDLDRLCNSDYEKQQYCVVEMKAKTYTGC